MKPVDMLVPNHNPAEGRIGDCFRCAVASILELPAADVPHFMDYPWDDPDQGRWFKDLNEWLRPYGLAYMEVTAHPDAPWDWDAFKAAGFDPFHIMSGNSIRAKHSVVAMSGEIVHDPHPARLGLVGPNEDDGLYHYGFFVVRGDKEIFLRLKKAA